MLAVNEQHLSQQSLLQPDHRTQNTDSVEDFEKQAESQTSKYGKPEWFEKPKTTWLATAFPF
ncbi:hypothetical protein HC752_23645 [Vibrio sp. S9_S30]|uniref:hypothetical protein n=1 Tax=Vibrio sp. S9_S30 TaxID=2720226 RepID=UPI0016810EE6|nr:hypothetical protein [Vibrio sp. S9_S30]MBD1559922.1 hypothetical protein [Vibrio sp. S9_S30]